MSRRLGVTLSAAALALGVAACGDDDDTSADTAADTTDSATLETDAPGTSPAPTTDAPAPTTEAPATTAAPTTGAPATTGGADQVDAFCQAEMAAEAAASSEDPAAAGPAFEALSAAAPADIKPTVDKVLELASSGQEDSPDFSAGYAEMLTYVKDNCGFGELAVAGSEYAFGGVPESLDAGPVVIDFENTGKEFHEFMVLRVNDGVTESLEQLLALPEKQAQKKLSPVGAAFAPPGETGNTVLDLQPGRHIAVCFLPEGATPKNMPKIESGEHQGAPHAMKGMVQEFTVS